MVKINRRKLIYGGSIGVLGAVSAPAVARAETRRWRMVTSWPKRLPAGRKYDRSAMHGRIRASKADRAALMRHPFGD